MTKCVIWKGAVNNKGYGVRRHNGKNILVHRLAYKVSNPGEDVTGKLVLHRCDVRRCVRADHLFTGTAKDNTADMLNKGRGNWARGEDAAKSKLTWEQICVIRKTYIPGRKGNLKTLYTMYGLSKTAMLNIVKGRAWQRRR